MLHHFCWTGAQTLSDARRVLTLWNRRFVWAPEHLTENQDTSPLCLCFPAAELRLFTPPLSVITSFVLSSLHLLHLYQRWLPAWQTNQIPFASGQISLKMCWKRCWKCGQGRRLMEKILLIFVFNLFFLLFCGGGVWGASLGPKLSTQTSARSFLVTAAAFVAELKLSLGKTSSKSHSSQTTELLPELGDGGFALCGRSIFSTPKQHGQLFHLTRSWSR